MISQKSNKTNGDLYISRHTDPPEVYPVVGKPLVAPSRLPTSSRSLVRPLPRLVPWTSLPSARPTILICSFQLDESSLLPFWLSCPPIARRLCHISSNPLVLLVAFHTTVPPILPPPSLPTVLLSYLPTISSILSRRPSSPSTV